MSFNIVLYKNVFYWLSKARLFEITIWDIPTWHEKIFKDLWVQCHNNYDTSYCYFVGLLLPSFNHTKLHTKVFPMVKPRILSDMGDCSRYTNSSPICWDQLHWFPESRVSASSDVLHVALGLFVGGGGKLSSSFDKAFFTWNK